MKRSAEKIKEFIASLKTNESSPIAFESMYLMRLTTFKILDSLTIRQP